MREDKISNELFRMCYKIYRFINNEEEFTKSDWKDLYDCVWKAKNIVEALENKQRSLNNLSEELKEYSDKINSLLD